jgi:hypothetical protein
MLSAEEAGSLLGAEPPNVSRAKEILGHIWQADQHATEIISHVKKLLKRRSDIEAQEFDLNEAIADAIQILSPEAKKRKSYAASYGHPRAIVHRGPSRWRPSAAFLSGSALRPSASSLYQTDI